MSIQLQRNDRNRFGALRALSVVVAGLSLIVPLVSPTLAGTPAESPTAEPETAPKAPARPVTVHDAAFSYFPADSAKQASRRIFRLTRDQIDATVQTLLPKHYKQSVKTAMAKDPLQTNYEYAELLSYNNANVRPLTKWIAEIAARVRVAPAGVIDCNAAASPDPCPAEQARRFILRAFRGDVEEEVLERNIKFFLDRAKAGSVANAAGDLVEVVLGSPQFLFRAETDIGDRRARTLAPPQLLQMLTYGMADVPPEKLGFNSLDAARYVRKAADARTTIDKILASKDSREKLMRFFTAWLELKDPDEFTISREIFPEFTPELATAMREETQRFLRAQLAKPSPKLSDITQSTEAYVSKALEAIYGLKAADPNGAKPVALDGNQRIGIFSQPAVIASHSGPTNTRPVKRGVFWVRKVMCLEAEPPPPDLHIKTYEEVKTTERKRIEMSTRQANCMGCHKTINPLGFFQESYDALGRWRTSDNGFPVDAGVSLNFLDEGEAETEGPVEALKVLTNSMRFKQCFLRQMFRFYAGRSEEPADDPLLKDMFLVFNDNNEQSILKMVEMLAASDRINRRQ